MPTSSRDYRHAAEAGPFARILVGSISAEGGADAQTLAAQLATLCGAKLVLADPVDPSDEASHSAARRLHDAAISQHADLIVVGSSDREPIGRRFSVSLAARLLSGAACAVAIAPRGYATVRARPLNSILAAVDSSPESRIALRAAHDLATRAGATLRVVRVLIPNSPGVPVGRGIPLRGVDVDVSPVEAEDPATLRLAAALRRQETIARAMLAAALAELHGARGIERQILLGPDAAFMIVEAARDDVDLIVLGSRARGPLRRALLGSVSNEVVRHAPCPVLVVPRAKRPAGATQPGAYTAVGIGASG